MEVGFYIGIGLGALLLFGIVSAIVSPSKPRSKRSEEMSEREIAQVIAQAAGSRAAEYKGQVLQALKDRGPVLQADLLKEIAGTSQKEKTLFYAASAELEEAGRIARERKGRSYMLHLVERDKLE